MRVCAGNIYKVRHKPLCPQENPAKNENWNGAPEALELGLRIGAVEATVKFNFNASKLNLSNRKIVRLATKVPHVGVRNIRQAKRGGRLKPRRVLHAESFHLKAARDGTGNRAGNHNYRNVEILLNFLEQSTYSTN